MNAPHTWQTQLQHQLENKAAELDAKGWKTYQIDFILGAIKKAPAHIEDETGLTAFRKETEELIEAIPGKECPKASTKKFSKQFMCYKSMLIRKYKLVPKGYYIGIAIAIGMGVGTSFGLLIKNMAIGIAMGMGIGIAIGSSLNAKAEKEGKVLS